MTRYAKHGRCWRCSAETTGDHYCHGCHEFVCPKCDKLQPMGPHAKEAHLEPAAKS
jgi:hypothetical protein